MSALLQTVVKSWGCAYVKERKRRKKKTPSHLRPLEQLYSSNIKQQPCKRQSRVVIFVVGWVGATKPTHPAKFQKGRTWQDTKLSLPPDHRCLLHGTRYNFHTQVAEPLGKVVAPLWGGKRWKSDVAAEDLVAVEADCNNGSWPLAAATWKRNFKTRLQPTPGPIGTAWEVTEWKTPLGLQPFISDARGGEGWLPSPPRP